ncbi:PIN domain-containing protein [Streptomyces sp. NPDC055092]
MIIFDTNAVNLLPHEGPRPDIIRKLRQSGHHRVAVPWMVLEEMAAHQAKHYPAKYQTVVNTLDKLREVLPWELKSTLEPLDVERLLNHWRGLYSEIFEVIETSGEVARRALAREAMALPPAKRGGDHSEGARDVAIWFSILEFLKENPDEKVCFVTNNTKDFGNGVDYPYPMNEDVEGLQERITRLSDFDAVVSTFTKTVSGKDAEAVADELLRALPVRSRVAQTAVEVLASVSGFVGLGAADTAVRWSGWFASPEVELLAVTDVTGHEIEGDVWYTANARWLLYGLAVDGDEANPGYTACVWETRVLFSARDGDEMPTLLAPKEPEAPDASDPASMEILKRLKARVAGVTRRAVSEWLQAGSAAENLVSKEFLDSLDVAGSLRRNVTAALLPQRDIDAFHKRLGEQLAQSVDLTGLNRSVAELLRPKVDFSDVVRRSLADAMPKLDIAAMLPRIDFGGIAGVTGSSGDDADDEEHDLDGQLSFDDDQGEPDGEDGTPDVDLSKG